MDARASLSDVRGNCTAAAPPILRLSEYAGRLARSRSRSVRVHFPSWHFRCPSWVHFTPSRKDTVIVESSATYFLNPDWLLSLGGMYIWCPQDFGIFWPLSPLVRIGQQIYTIKFMQPPLFITIYKGNLYWGTLFKGFFKLKSTGLPTYSNTGDIDTL